MRKEECRLRPGEGGSLSRGQSEPGPVAGSITVAANAEAQRLSDVPACLAALVGAALSDSGSFPPSNFPAIPPRRCLQPSYPALPFLCLPRPALLAVPPSRQPPCRHTTPTHKPALQGHANAIQHPTQHPNQRHPATNSTTVPQPAPHRGAQHITHLDEAVQALLGDGRLRAKAVVVPRQRVQGRVHVAAVQRCRGAGAGGGTCGWVGGWGDGKQ